MALNFYPELNRRTLDLLRCSQSIESVNNAILQWRADDLETAAAEQGLVLAKVRTNEEFRRELQYTEVLSKMPLVTVEKIADTEPIPFKPGAKMPLDEIRALGMGHVIAGAGIGRDLAFYGADVLNIWTPNSTEMESSFWDAQVGMRSTILGSTILGSTILDSSREERAKFDLLLQDADVFYAPDT
jgi:hypothetical protein